MNGQIVYQLLRENVTRLQRALCFYTKPIINIAHNQSLRIITIKLILVLLASSWPSLIFSLTRLRRFIIMRSTEIWSIVQEYIE